MDGNYDIFRGGEKIGKAQVARQGLYYRFRCCCALTGSVIYRLTATCGEKTENLGVLVPDADVFRLEKKLPVSRFPEGALVIRAVPANPDKGAQFAPVYPDEPFRYIAKLHTARMQCRDGQVGVVFEDTEDAHSALPLSSSSR